jgi:hypothetical protein
MEWDSCRNSRTSEQDTGKLWLHYTSDLASLSTHCSARKPYLLPILGVLCDFFCFIFKQATLKRTAWTRVCSVHRHETEKHKLARKHINKYNNNMSSTEKVGGLNFLKNLIIKMKRTQQNRDVRCHPKSQQHVQWDKPRSIPSKVRRKAKDAPSTAWSHCRSALLPLIK